MFGFGHCLMGVQVVPRFLPGLEAKPDSSKFLTYYLVAPRLKTLQWPWICDFDADSRATGTGRGPKIFVGIESNPSTSKGLHFYYLVAGFFEPSYGPEFTDTVHCTVFCLRKPCCNRGAMALSQARPNILAQNF